MIQLIVLILIIYFLVKFYSSSKAKAKSKKSPPAAAPTRPATPTKTAAPAAQPKKSAPAAADDFPGIDPDEFAKAMAAMSGDSPAPTTSAPASNEAADRKWVREHPFTDYICGFYATIWGPGGGIYEKVNAGELPIVRVELRVEATQIHETLHLQDGGNFESDTTFDSFDQSNQYTRLDTAAKRDELHKCLIERLSALPTISVKSDGLHVITGISGAAPAPAPEKPAAEKPAGDEFSGIDADAFARAMAAMSGETPPPKKEEPKSEPPKAEPPKAKPVTAAPTPENYEAFLKKVLAYYHSMWNKETGSLYTELDTTMPIDHFAVQVRENCLVESVWLQGDNIPLVTETEYTKICGETPIYPLNSAEEQTKLLVAIAKFLVQLGTVTLKGNDFYPVRAAASKPAEPAKPAESAPGETDADAALRAQMQAMLDQMQQDGGDQ